MSIQETIRRAGASLRAAPERLRAFFAAQPGNFVQSAKELKSVRSIAGMAMLLAVSIILSQFSVALTPQLKVGLAFLATALLGMIYGPVAGGVAAGVGDIIKFILKPSGAFFFGFTLNAILGGVFYGIFFYKNKPGVTRSVVSKLLINLLVNAGLGTLWSSMLYGKGFMALIGPRLIKNLTLLPIEALILFVVTAAVAKALGRYLKGRTAAEITVLIR